jgi:pimeloyl-ACP methyl ester carboxylesterase
MVSLLLLPGLLNDHRLWDHQRQALASQAHVAVPDLTLDESVADMARRVLDSAPPRFFLAGLSMGGYVALEILRQQPQRVQGLAMVDSSPLPDIQLTQQGGFGKIMPTMLPLLVHPDHVDLPQVGGLAKDMARAVGPDAFIRQQTAIMGRPDSRPFLPHISCPSVMIVGQDDALTPPQRAAEMAAAIPNGKMVVISQCGHLSALEQPQAVSAVLSYWLQS